MDALVEILDKEQITLENPVNAYADSSTSLSSLLDFYREYGFQECKIPATLIRFPRPGTADIQSLDH